jgi:hypothetical protein
MSTMAIELNSGGGASGDYTPYISLPVKGDSATFGVVDVVKEDMVDFKTGQVRVTQQGKPRKQIKLTVLIKEPGAKAADGKDDEGMKLYKDLEVGSLAFLTFSGHNWYDPDTADHLTWSAASDAFGTVTVGTVGHIVFERTAPSGGAEPKKIFQTRLRAPKDDEAAFVAQCEAAYHAIHDIALTTPAAAPAARAMLEDAF